jgi:hypothetical protein
MSDPVVLRMPFALRSKPHDARTASASCTSLPPARPLAHVTHLSPHPSRTLVSPPLLKPDSSHTAPSDGQLATLHTLCIFAPLDHKRPTRPPPCLATVGPFAAGPQVPHPLTCRPSAAFLTAHPHASEHNRPHPTQHTNCMWLPLGIEQQTSSTSPRAAMHGCFIGHVRLSGTHQPAPTAPHPPLHQPLSCLPQPRWGGGTTPPPGARFQGAARN